MISEIDFLDSLISRWADEEWGNGLLNIMQAMIVSRRAELEALHSDKPFKWTTRNGMDYSCKIGGLVVGIVYFNGEGPWFALPYLEFFPPYSFNSLSEAKTFVEETIIDTMLEGDYKRYVG